jgi:hypothetical protein
MASWKEPGMSMGTSGRSDYGTRVPSDVVERETVVVETEEEAPLPVDRVRWTSIWAGLVVALTTYLLLQLALVALDIVDIADLSTGEAVASAIVALVAFFVGGLVTGATAWWRRVDDGLLHGVILWAVGVVAIVALSLAGGGIALGALNASDTFDELTSENVDEEAENDAQDAAGYALLGMVAALIAASAGAVVGAKLWPDEDDRTIDLTRTDLR